MSTNLQSYITVAEAAELIGVSYSTAAKYCSDGDLPSTRFGWERLVKRADAKRFKRPKRGNPNFVRKE